MLISLSIVICFRPVDYLAIEENRISYAMAYGATAVSIFGLFFGSISNDRSLQIIPQYGPAWVQGQNMIKIIDCIL